MDSTIPANRSLVTCQNFVLIIFNVDTTSMEPVFAYFTFNSFLIHLHGGTTYLTIFVFVGIFSAYCFELLRFFTSEFEFFRPCADAMINLIVKKSVSEKNVSDKKCVNRILTVKPLADSVLCLRLHYTLLCNLFHSPIVFEKKFC